MIHFKIVFLLITIVFHSVAHANDRVGYPDNYRSWAHVKSMAIHSGHPLENPFKGLHHVYANEKALQGLKTGRYKDGATLVFDLLEYDTKSNASTEGKRVLLGVMTKNRSKFKQTGGWGFEGFAGNSETQRLVNDGGHSCYACHAPEADKDYVFSQWRD